MPKAKPLPAKFGQNLNSSHEYSPTKMATMIKQTGSPNHYSFNNQMLGDSLSFDNPSASFHRKNNSIANELKKRLMNITSSSPFSMKNSMMECEREPEHYVEPTLERSAHPKA